eukprot:8088-Heterococcus_DN1.PRE.3
MLSLRMLPVGCSKVVILGIDTATHTAMMLRHAGPYSAVQRALSPVHILSVQAATSAACATEYKS